MTHEWRRQTVPSVVDAASGIVVIEPEPNRVVIRSTGRIELTQQQTSELAAVLVRIGAHM
jgi:hypothetical protein